MSDKVTLGGRLKKKRDKDVFEETFETKEMDV